MNSMIKTSDSAMTTPDEIDPSELEVRAIADDEHRAARDLVLAGMQEHWGAVDPSANPDLDQIGKSYRDGIFAVALYRGELVATGSLLPLPDLPDEPPTGQIQRMTVTKELRRLGVASRMLEFLREEARRRGLRRIVLETSVRWNEATSFYRAHGFHELGIRDGDRYFAMELS